MDSQELQRLKNKYDIIGNDAALNRALETAVAVAPTDLTVLVTGEAVSARRIFLRSFTRTASARVANTLP